LQRVGLLRIKVVSHVTSRCSCLLRRTFWSSGMFN
jgi:hypothetical protein